MRLPVFYWSTPNPPWPRCGMHTCTSFRHSQIQTEIHFFEKQLRVVCRFFSFWIWSLCPVMCTSLTLYWAMNLPTLIAVKSLLATQKAVTWRFIMCPGRKLRRCDGIKWIVWGSHQNKIGILKIDEVYLWEFYNCIMLVFFKLSSYLTSGIISKCPG